MKCKFCGEELEEGATLCQACGKSVEETACECGCEETCECGCEETCECSCEETCECSCEETCECSCEETCECSCEETCECSCEETCECECGETCECECGENSEEAPKKKFKLPKIHLKPWQRWTIIACCAVIVLGVLVGYVLPALGISVLPGKNNVEYKKSYTVSSWVLKNRGDTVVATLNGKELTNAELQLYYWMVYDYQDRYDSELADDVALHEQKKDDLTYQQYLLEEALNIWEYYITACLLAEEAGYTMTDAEIEALAELPAQMEEMAAEKKQSIDELLSEMLCPGINQEAYMTYTETYQLGNGYMETLFDTIVPTQEEMETFYAENEDLFKENNITKDQGNSSDVRHILIMPKGGTEDENGEVTYSEDEWAQCYAKAEELLEQWKKGEATEESFAELANEHSEDGGSNTKGGLYTGITSTSNFVPNFLNWSIDESRQVGDTGIVESPYGYHIMYYVGSEPLWMVASKEACVGDLVDKMIEECSERWPMEVNYKKILLSEDGR